MTETDRQIRLAIKHRIVDLGITQQEVADRLGIRKQAVSATILGKRGLLPKSLLELLDALGLELVAVPKQE